MDPYLLLAQLLLSGFGLVVVATAAPGLFVSHAAKLGVALLVTLVTSRASLPFFLKWARWLYAGAVLLLFLAILIGVDVRPGKDYAHRWLVFGGISFQPAELSKLLLVFYLARFFEDHGTDYPVLGPVTVIALAVSLVAMEPDFATAAFHLILALFILLAIGVPWRRLFAIGISSFLIAMSLQGLYLSRFGHVLERFRAFFSGEQGVYQVVRAKEAIVAGGLFGQGPGASMPYVPYAYNDMAFATLAFALGWLGVTLLFLAYGIIFFRGMQIAVNLQGGISVVALGMTAALTLQAAVHTAVVLGLLPTTGIPLPMISYGGTSLVASGLALGFLHAASNAAFPRGKAERGEAQ